MSRKPPEPYSPSVGYGRPPAEHQFRPGQSGNPKGRPKGSRDKKSVFKAFMSQKVTITENGKSRKMTREEVLINKMFIEGMRGDTRVLIKLNELNIKYAMDEKQKENMPLPPEPGLVILPGDLNDVELEFLARKMERMMAEEKAAVEKNKKL